jgi:hypothetical protein
MVMNFMQKAVAGQIDDLDVIDDYINEWHDGDSEEDLHEFLGMTWSEYVYFSAAPSRMANIVAERVRVCSN